MGATTPPMFEAVIMMIKLQVKSEERRFRLPACSSLATLPLRNVYCLEDD